ncbi:hypothetical protein ACFU99_38160, partial [Streptomyces sp. NPDC057654]
MSERIGNVTRERHERLVAESRAHVAQVGGAQVAVGDAAREIEPIRPVGGFAPKATDEHPFTVADSPGRFAEDIGVAASTVEDSDTGRGGRQARSSTPGLLPRRRMGPARRRPAHRGLRTPGPVLRVPPGPGRERRGP